MSNHFKGAVRITWLRFLFSILRYELLKANNKFEAHT